MQRDVSGPMKRLRHRNRMQTASPPPSRVLIKYAKSLLCAPPIGTSSRTQISMCTRTSMCVLWYIHTHTRGYDYVRYTCSRLAKARNLFSSKIHSNFNSIYQNIMILQNTQTDLDNIYLILNIAISEKNDSIYD